MPSTASFWHPATGEKVSYLFHTPAGHFLESSITHKIRERNLRQEYFFPFIDSQQSVFIDIGAAYGSWSIPAALLGAHVFAVDPRLDVCNILAGNFASNGISPEQAIIINAAASDVVSEAGFELCDSGNSTTINADQTHLSCRSHQLVPTVTIDSVVQDFGLERVDFIKVDAEGVEMQVMRGAENTIRDFMPNMIVENHLSHNATVMQQIIDFVQQIQPNYGQILTGTFGWLAQKRPHSIFLR